MISILADKLEVGEPMFVTEIEFEHYNKLWHAEFGIVSDLYGNIKIDYRVIFNADDKELSDNAISDKLWGKLTTVAIERYKDSYDRGEMYEYS